MQVDELIENNQPVSRELWDIEVANRGKDLVIDYLWKLLRKGYQYGGGRFFVERGPRLGETPIFARAPTEDMPTASPLQPEQPTWVTAVDPAQELVLRRTPPSPEGVAGQQPGLTLENLRRAYEQLSGMRPDEAEHHARRLQEQFIHEEHARHLAAHARVMQERTAQEAMRVVALDALTDNDANTSE